jgi:hypothetical protein
MGNIWEKKALPSGQELLGGIGWFLWMGKTKSEN